MSRLLALGWLALLLVAGGHLMVRAFDGLNLRTDLLALLPKEEQDPALSQANDRIMQKLAGRVILLVGSQDRAQARRAASEIEDTLASTKLIALDGLGTGTADPAALGAFYFRYRGGLLSEQDRRLLAAGDGAAVAERALAQVYGVGSFADAKLLAADPFLLLPRFLTGLPVPPSRLTLDEGRLSVQERDITWVLIAGRLLSDPYELDTQERLVSALDKKIADLGSSDRTLSVKRAGAVFFARSGANIGLTEASLLGSISLIGTVALLLVVFRHLLPLVLNVFTLLIGTGAALSATLAVFGEIHIMTLLFGVGLIGVAVDYGLHYSASAFDPGTYSPHERLMHVLPAISLGLLTTLIGYVMLALAPFPGLRQIAFFSTIGLVAAFLTVTLWFPLVRDARPARSKDMMMRWAEAPWRLWEIGALRPVRWTAILLLAALGVAGLTRLDTNDDVRSMQSLSPELVVQQADIQRVAGLATGWQSILVTAEDDEAALIAEEGIDQTLDSLVKSGAMAAHRAPASFVPSQARQRENAKLVDEQLVKPFLATQRARLGLTAEPSLPPPDTVTLSQAVGSGAVGFLDDLVLAPGQHLIVLDAVTDPIAVRNAMTSTANARFIDPTEDFSRLLAKYRHRAVWLIAASTILMLVPLWWRYGARGALIVIAPALAAVVLAPALIALTGQAISFFHVMALMIVLSIGVDFAIFCAEGSEGRRLSASLAVVLAAMTTLLSFGILAFSQVLAVHSFGLTLLLGVLIAFLLAPVALQVRPVRRCQPRTEVVS
jgi:predicted exporter